MYKYNNASYASSEVQDEKLAVYLKSKATCSCILERREKGLPGLRHSALFIRNWLQNQTANFSILNAFQRRKSWAKTVISRLIANSCVEPL